MTCAAPARCREERGAGDEIMTEQIIIGRRYCGPPSSANGGYACGAVARFIGDEAAVRLVKPPPLDTRLELRETDGRVEAWHGGDRIAEGRRGTITAPAPEAVSLDRALEAVHAYPWREGHPFPTCFVCGPRREAGDGLRIFPGPVTGTSVVAAPWVPDATVCGPDGNVRSENVWAALDCPSWFGALVYGGERGPALLGQLTASLHEMPRAGDRCVSVGWSRGREGRKIHAGAAIFSEFGDLLARSEAIWIALDRLPEGVHADPAYRPGV